MVGFVSMNTSEPHVNWFARPAVAIPILRLRPSATQRNDPRSFTLPIESAIEERPPRSGCFLRICRIATGEIPWHSQPGVLSSVVGEGRPDSRWRPGHDGGDPRCVEPRPTESKRHVSAQAAADGHYPMVSHLRGSV